jgi:acetylglutamate kinase
VPFCRAHGCDNVCAVRRCVQQFSAHRICCSLLQATQLLMLNPLQGLSGNVGNNGAVDDLSSKKVSRCFRQYIVGATLKVNVQAPRTTQQCQAMNSVDQSSFRQVLLHGARACSNSTLFKRGISTKFIAQN